MMHTRRVAHVEIAPLHQRNAHGCEVTRTHRIQVWILILAGIAPITFHGNRAFPCVAPQNRNHY